MEGFKKTNLKVSDVKEGQLVKTEVDGEEIVIANVKGKFYGIYAYCKHEEWDLSEGELIDTKIKCAGHGSIWDLETGKAEFVEPLEDEPIYEVKVINGYLYVRKKTNVAEK
jgi:3-phenylpropionate/trans-cinnamate dioxygenase ferredoxin subunit